MSRSSAGATAEAGEVELPGSPPPLLPKEERPARLEPTPRKPAGTPQPSVAGVGAWIVAWGELVLLGFLALIGAFFAAAADSPGDYACGLILIVTSIALAFIRLKARFDGASGDWSSFLLVDDWPNFIMIAIAFAVLGFAGLFVAASYDEGGLHNAGVALFAVSALAVFLNLKRVFDNFDRQR